jgi:8-oxo-dGTP pyrophosphatase MutT (NUDIX family)
MKKATTKKSGKKKETKSTSRRDAKRKVKVASPTRVERRQIAALPYRKTAAGEIEVLLITSRESGRFIIPKGWPMKGLRDPDAAAKEAYEEAGVTGKIERKPLGTYSYWKRLERSVAFLRVTVYPLEVRKQRSNWPEKGSRRLGWLKQKDAATLVDVPGLITLIERFRD